MKVQHCSSDHTSQGTPNQNVLVNKDIGSYKISNVSVFLISLGHLAAIKISLSSMNGLAKQQVKSTYNQ